MKDFLEGIPDILKYLILFGVYIFYTAWWASDSTHTMKDNQMAIIENQKIFLNTWPLI